jgi:atypical dual specificity phosphatase
MFAPSLVDISRAVDFIHRNASCGRMTYIHCKAGRGRSTTIVLCYLVVLITHLLVIELRSSDP